MKPRFVFLLNVFCLNLSKRKKNPKNSEKKRNRILHKIKWIKKINKNLNKFNKIILILKNKIMKNKKNSKIKTNIILNNKINKSINIKKLKSVPIISSRFGSNTSQNRPVARVKILIRLWPRKKIPIGFFALISFIFINYFWCFKFLNFWGLINSKSDFQTNSKILKMKIQNIKKMKIQKLPQLNKYNKI